MAESREVTLSPEANAAVQHIAARLDLPFEKALGMAIGTQLEILNQTAAGKRVSISPDGRSLEVRSA